MKKIIILLTAILMMSTMLVGCSDSSENGSTAVASETTDTDNNENTADSIDSNFGVRVTEAVASEITDTDNNENTADNIDSNFGVRVTDDGDHYISGLKIGEKDCKPIDLWLEVYMGATSLDMMIEDGWKVTDKSISEIEKFYGCSFDDVELAYGEKVFLDLEKDGVEISVKVKNDDFDPEYNLPIGLAGVYSVWVGDFASLGMELDMPDLHKHFGPEETFDDYVYRIKDYDVTVKEIRNNYIRFYERVEGFDENDEDWDCFMNLIFDENGILDFINVGSLD